MKSQITKAFSISILLLTLFYGVQNVNAQSSSEETYNQEVENLAAFAKSYGYIRFFYPNEQTKDFNWDAFLVYGTKKVRNLETDEELKNSLEELFSPIAPHAVFSSNENEELSIKPIAQGDSISFWQHSSFSLGENMGAKSGGSFIKLLVTTEFDSTRVIQADSPFIGDEVHYEHIDYRNDARFYYPDNFRDHYNQEAGVKQILGKQPDPSEPFSSELIDNLWITMPVVLTKQEGQHHATKADVEIFSEELESFYAEEEAIFQANDIWYADFILVWNAYHHFFPYRKSSEEAFKFSSSEQLCIGLDQISDAADKKDTAYHVVRNYVSLFQDGHANVRRYRTPEVKEQNAETQNIEKSWLPFYRIASHGKVYVMRSFDPLIKNGDEILEIDDTDISDLLEQEVTRRVSSPQYNLLNAIGTIGYFINTSEVKVKFKRDGKVLTVMVKTIPAPAKEYFEYRTNPYKHEPIEYPDSNTVYINLALISSDKISQNFDRVLNAAHLIIDLRGYPNSYSTRQIFEHLPVEEGLGKGLIINTPLIMYPNQEYRYNIWSSSLKVPKKPFINAEISVLVSNSIPSGTRSRGETFASYFKYAGATLIGDSNTAGASGGIDWFTTPGKIRVNLTTSYTVRQNGEEMQSIGITPDILIKHTPERLKAGKDQLYEAALERIQNEQ